MAYTGICGTDLHIYHGDMDSRVGADAIIGHEMSGRIAALGEDVTGWSVGQPVTVLPTRWCGRCAACQRGHSHICHAMNFLGIDSPGAMQSSWNVPAELVLPLPEELPLDQGALVEPVAVAVHDVRRGQVASGDHVVVVGGGPIGVLIGTVAQGRGARVLLVEPDPARRAVAGEVGIEAVDPGAVDVAAFVADRTDGAGADVAFEVSGAAAGVGTAVEVLAARGRLVMVAIHPRPGGQPAPVLLARVGTARRPPLPAGRHGGGDPAGRLRRDPGPAADLPGRAARGGYRGVHRA
ncbi:hypothetical protein GCM10029963_23280 [Micromonospora andamanensis]